MERDAVTVASLSEGVLEGTVETPVAQLERIASRYQADTGGRVVVVDRRGRALVDSAPDRRRHELRKPPGDRGRAPGDGGVRREALEHARRRPPVRRRPGRLGRQDSRRGSDHVSDVYRRSACAPVLADARRDRRDRARRRVAAGALGGARRRPAAAAARGGGGRGRRGPPRRPGAGGGPRRGAPARRGVQRHRGEAEAAARLPAGIRRRRFPRAADAADRPAPATREHRLGRGRAGPGRGRAAGQAGRGPPVAGAGRRRRRGDPDGRRRRRSGRPARALARGDARGRAGLARTQLARAARADRRQPGRERACRLGFRDGLGPWRRRLGRAARRRRGPGPLRRGALACLRPLLEGAFGQDRLRARPRDRAAARDGRRRRGRAARGAGRRSRRCRPPPALR